MRDYKFAVSIVPADSIERKLSRTRILQSLDESRVLYRADCDYLIDEIFFRTFLSAIPQPVLDE
jgi:hypothetical protein